MLNPLRKAKRASTAALSRVLETQRDLQFHDRNYVVTVLRATELSSALKEAVWNLFEANMENLYKSTNVFEWDPVKKRAELFHNNSRFLLVTPEDKRLEAELAAYSMFRFETEENIDGENENVLYCYELQVVEACRGLGLGKFLARILEKLAREWRMVKVMLTVLIVNVNALRFYQREGFITDAISPKDEGYYILSKTV